MLLLFKLVNEGFKLCLDGETAFEVEREPALTRVFGQRGGRVCFQALLRSEEAAMERYQHLVDLKAMYDKE